MIDDSLKQRPKDLAWLENQVHAGDEEVMNDPRETRVLIQGLTETEHLELSVFSI